MHGNPGYGRSGFYNYFTYQLPSEKNQSMRLMNNLCSNLGFFQTYAAIKWKSDLVFGAHHLFQEIKAARESQLPPNEEKAIMDAIKRNAFHAHPHSIIVAMLGKLLPYRPSFGRP